MVNGVVATQVIHVTKLLLVHGRTREVVPTLARDTTFSLLRHARVALIVAGGHWSRLIRRGFALLH